MIELASFTLVAEFLSRSSQKDQDGSLLFFKQNSFPNFDQLFDVMFTYSSWKVKDNSITGFKIINEVSVSSFLDVVHDSFAVFK